MSKEIRAILSSSTSEVTKDKVLQAAGVSENAATVIRDANGKIVEVVIALPDSAADAAETAILATLGVANVNVEDILPGTTGFDSTAEGKTAFLAAGGAYNLDGHVTETFNADGTVTYASTLDFDNGVDIRLPSTLPSHPETFDLEWRCSFPNMGDPTKRSFMTLRGTNTQTSVTGLLGSNDFSVGGVTGPYVVQLNGATPSDVVTSSTTAGLGTGFNDYKIKFTGTKAEAFVNGTLVGETTDVTQLIARQNEVTFRWQSRDPDDSLILDYIRWTTV